MASWLYALLTILPQLSIAPIPLHPNPKNERNASVKTALETVNTDSAQTRGMTLGRMCFRRMYAFPAPTARARSMNWRSLSESTCDRMTRVVVGQLTRAMAKMIVCRLGELQRTLVRPYEKGGEQGHKYEDEDDDESGEGQLLAEDFRDRFSKACKVEEDSLLE